MKEVIGRCTSWIIQFSALSNFLGLKHQEKINNLCVVTKFEKKLSICLD